MVLLCAFFPLQCSSVLAFILIVLPIVYVLLKYSGPIRKSRLQPWTVAGVDHIIVLDDGQLVEEGSHDELLTKNERYADMWRMQSGGP